jgi:hypothetical protein
LLGLIRLILRFVGLTLFILGVRRALEIAQGGVEAIADRIEEDEAGGIERTLVRVHEALHRREAHHSGGTEPLGEM